MDAYVRVRNPRTDEPPAPENEVRVLALAAGLVQQVVFANSTRKARRGKARRAIHSGQLPCLLRFTFCTLQPHTGICGTFCVGSRCPLIRSC